MMNREIDKGVYDMPMTWLNNYKLEALGIVCYKPGIDSFEYNGETFRRDDMVVVDGMVGYIECVNIEAGYCSLGASFDYDDTMACKGWTMGVHYRCKLDDIRHANDEEISNFLLLLDEYYDAMAGKYRNPEEILEARRAKIKKNHYDKARITG